MSNRIKIKTYLHQIVDEKIQHFQQLIEDLRASNTETKSSMGDKFETSREMLQQEVMRVQKQLANVQEQKQILSRMRDTTNKNIAFGSIVKTSVGDFVIAISIGKFKVDEGTYISVSEQTPLAQQLISKTIGDTFLFQQKEAQILEVE